MQLRRILHPILRPLGRVRRSRGFGVHSPFAFRFITFTLRDTSAAYYSTPILRRLATGPRHYSHLSLLFRIVCDRRPRTLILTPDLTDTIRRTIRLADSRLTPVAVTHPEKQPAPLLYLTSLTPDNIPLARTILTAENSTLIIETATTAALTELKKGLAHIMTFTNRRTAILVSRHDLPLQTFEINF